MKRGDFVRILDAESRLYGWVVQIASTWEDEIGEHNYWVLANDRVFERHFTESELELVSVLDALAEEAE